jgi:cyclopropane-fatty-acyl-phospholipid synthase
MDTLLPYDDIINGKISDTSIKKLIQFGSAKMLKELNDLPHEKRMQKNIELFHALKKLPIAIEESAANEQHYEQPPAFFDLVLGKHRKYSCCYWPEGCQTLDQAEEEMLKIVCARGQVKDGMKILDLGCGWGALSLHLAATFPNAQITGLSNSKPQREFILKKAQEMGLRNLEIITANIVDVNLSEKFDRILSIEMLEHMRNYEVLFHKLASWLKPSGLLFAHIFVHKEHHYVFEDNWTSKYFFTGGMMPSEHTLLFFQKDLKIQDMWRVNGSHYEKTADAWLVNQDQKKEAVMKILQESFHDNAEKVFHMWRMFFLVCSASFGFQKGTEWYVAHYLFSK